MDPKVSRTSIDLLAKVNQQVELLKLACLNYDNNIEIAGFNIATSIRVFLHDTGQSHSALKHLNRKGIDFLNTCNVNLNPAKTFIGLIYSYFEGVHDGQGGIAKFRPLFTSDFQSNVYEWVDFDKWWNAVVFQNPDGSILTRRSLVLIASNQEGGAHIDKEIDEMYDKFRHNYSSGTIMKGTITGTIRTFDNVPVLPAIRQIGYELIETLKHARLCES
jgi:hypothetical protein